MYSNKDWRNYKSDELYHHGILGQKWHVRRYQNSDGSLTEEGKVRYHGGTTNDARSLIDSGAKEIKDPVKRIEAVTADCWQINYTKQRNDPKAVERANKAADLGLKAINKIRGDGYVDEDSDVEYFTKKYGWSKEKAQKEIHEGNRDWFLYEDQTIGLPMIADLVNQGYSAKQVSKMIDIVNEAYDYDLKMSGNAEMAAFNIRESNWRNENKEFAKACEEVKKNSHH